MAGKELLPCFCCGELPKVGSFPLMTGRTGWTCLCRCHETNTYYDKEDAIAEWNEWVESEGVTEEDWDE